ncbi:hypothetical protein NPIL_286811 [Nephila pilipes]|uniref:Uncharacterized protein n=1 Tax=Nephila pilipes TaxID=299642 RepID=A0A8X6QNS7_NEPPI|nr:hypothetical protein NPIL_286811 [Nephila pilipes]
MFAYPNDSQRQTLDHVIRNYDSRKMIELRIPFELPIHRGMIENSQSSQTHTFSHISYKLGPITPHCFLANPVLVLMTHDVSVVFSQKSDNNFLNNRRQGLIHRQYRNTEWTGTQETPTKSMISSVVGLDLCGLVY